MRHLAYAALHFSQKFPIDEIANKKRITRRSNAKKKNGNLQEKSKTPQNVTILRHYGEFKNFEMSPNAIRLCFRGSLPAPNRSV